LKFWHFLTHLAFLKIKKRQTKSGFFQSEKLGSDKTLYELHIHYKFLLTRVYDHAGCKDIAKVALKMIAVLNKKQMYDSVITRKENASKVGIVLYRCF